MSELQKPSLEQQEKLNQFYPDGPVSNYIERVLDSLKASDLDEAARGRVAADHFVGSMLRAVGVEKGVDILANLAATESDKFVDNEGKTYQWDMALSRTAGTRRAAREIFDSEGLHSLYLFGHRNNLDPKKITLTSPDQVYAYLNTDTEATNSSSVDAAEPWQRTIYDEVLAFAINPHRKAAWLASENPSSDVLGVRKDQEAWERSVSVAKEIGVDMELIQRSAETLRNQFERGEKIGEAVLKLGPDYGWLFK